MKLSTVYLKTSPCPLLSRPRNVSPRNKYLLLVSLCQPIFYPLPMDATNSLRSCPTNGKILISNIHVLQEEPPTTVAETPNRLRGIYSSSFSLTIDPPVWPASISPASDFYGRYLLIESIGNWRWRLIKTVFCRFICRFFFFTTNRAVHR